jgi:hypothetical protein
LKRCAAFGLGDQFGLSLYNKGSMAALVGKTLVGADSQPGVIPDLESHVEVPRSLGNDERQDPDDEPAVLPPPARRPLRPRPAPVIDDPGRPFT